MPAGDARFRLDDGVNSLVNKDSIRSLLANSLNNDVGMHCLSQPPSANFRPSAKLCGNWWKTLKNKKLKMP